ncbi:hypothetical protein HanRHA438_Chr10g0460171 [Helianthus annuus]|nr:hypothetical protein HanRHA438_Chr10g0460171 [Helianthus annuus]
MFLTRLNNLVILFYAITYENMLANLKFEFCVVILFLFQPIKTHHINTLLIPHSKFTITPLSWDLWILLGVSKFRFGPKITENRNENISNPTRTQVPRYLDRFQFFI